MLFVLFSGPHVLQSLDLEVAVGRSVGLLLSNAFDSAHGAPYWPTWPCSSVVNLSSTFVIAIANFFGNDSCCVVLSEKVESFFFAQRH